MAIILDDKSKVMDELFTQNSSNNRLDILIKIKCYN